MSDKTEDYFVPNSTYGGRGDTAVALVGAADEHGISQRAIRAGQGGFWVSDELAGHLFSDTEDAPAKDAPTETPEGDPSSEEQTDKAPAKKSRSKK